MTYRGKARLCSQGCPRAPYMTMQWMITPDDSRRLKQVRDTKLTNNGGINQAHTRACPGDDGSHHFVEYKEGDVTLVSSVFLTGPEFMTFVRYYLPKCWPSDVPCTNECSFFQLYICFCSSSTFFLAILTLSLPEVLEVMLILASTDPA